MPRSQPKASATTGKYNIPEFISLRYLDTQVGEWIAGATPADLETDLPEFICKIREQIENSEKERGLSSAEIRSVVFTFGKLAKGGYLANLNINLDFVVDVAASLSACEGDKFHRLQEIANVVSALGDLAEANALPQRDYQSVITPLIENFKNRIDDASSRGSKLPNFNLSLNGLFYGIHKLIGYKKLLCDANDAQRTDVISKLSYNNRFTHDLVRKITLMLKLFRQPASLNQHSFQSLEASREEVDAVLTRDVLSALHLTGTSEGLMQLPPPAPITVFHHNPYSPALFSIYVQNLADKDEEYRKAAANSGAPRLLISPA